MPTLRWDRLTWEEFTDALVAFRDDFQGTNEDLNSAGAAEPNRLRPVWRSACESDRRAR
jgi:hypothetical protein